MQELATAQLHALFVAADELRNIRNELMEIRSILAAVPDTRAPEDRTAEIPGRSAARTRRRP
jgi:hypothetical protein